MNCDQAKPLVGPYADGELDAAGILELERHLGACPACTLAWRNVQNLQKAVKQDALFFTAPTELRRRVKAELLAQVENQSEQKFWNWNWLTTATTAASAVCLAILLAVTLARPTAQER